MDHVIEVEYACLVLAFDGGKGPGTRARLTAALRYAHKNPKITLVVAATRRPRSPETCPTDAELMARWLRQQGLVGKRIIKLEALSYSTRGEIEIALDKVSAKRWSVCSHVWHLPRSGKLFREHGITIQWVPVFAIGRLGAVLKEPFAYTGESLPVRLREQARQVSHWAAYGWFLR